jgi:phosphoribosylformimino-5-aminoimidazole carboxamide ribotide isomerase
MLIVPAIDLIGGKCVRLVKGDYAASTVFNDDPAAVARGFQEAGAKRIHVVDLDGAKAGRPVNLAAIESIARSVSIPVELGGGLRTLGDLQSAESAGVAEFILGTILIRDPGFALRAVTRWPGRIWIGIDARDGNVSVSGWLEGTATRAVDLAESWNAQPIRGFIVTDISKDGTLKGPGIGLLREVAAVVDKPLVASGGVSSIDDLLALLPLTKRGLEGAIVGMAIYTGAIDLRKAIEEVAKGC